MLADLHATQRELESTRGQLAEARATLASQAKALEMAAAQQNRMTVSLVILCICFFCRMAYLTCRV